MLLPSLAIVVCFSTPAELPEFEFDVHDKVVYSTVEDRELHLDVFVPKKDSPSPAVLVVHGGAWRSGNRFQLRGYATSLAQMGFVCFAIDYRLAPKDKFPAQIEDCRAAVKWIRENAEKYNVDVNRVGAIGYSAGGHLVSLLGTTGEAPSEANNNTDTRIQAVAAGGAPTDFRAFPDNGRWAEFWMGGDLSDVPDKFRDASPTVFVDKQDPPMFFFNGTNDRVVPLDWSVALFNSLKAVGVKTELHKVRGAGHIQAATDSEALEKAFTFLKSELLTEEKPAAEPEPSTED